MKPSKPPRARRGFLVFDALAGLAILGILTVLLAASINLRYRNAQHLANQRRALATAQHVLLNLQTGAALPAAGDDETISIQRSGTAIGRQEWFEVTVVRAGRRASVFGAAAATQPGGAP